MPYRPIPLSRTLLDRRSFFRGTLAVLGAGGLASLGCEAAVGPRTVASGGAVTKPPEGNSRADTTAFDDLEHDKGGRIGVYAVDLQTGMSVGHRADERFLTCSTVKTPLVAFTLRRVDLGLESLDRSISYGQADLLEYAPKTRANLARGAMTVRELCEAAITVSDNTAANLLFKACGGPLELDAFLRGIGDTTSHFDRIEPDLNYSDGPGDTRDTSTPRAMVGNLQKLLLGDALSQASRELLRTWHLATSTGPNRLRAGLPAAWKLAHKTGTSTGAATNDIGVAFPPDRAPLIIAVFYDDSPSPMEVREAVIAQVARICIS